MTQPSAQRDRAATDPACAFCRIADRTLAADIVGEAEGLLAFNDLHPQAPTHVLIIPTQHIASLAELREGHTMLIGEAIQFANRLAQRYHLEAGYRVVINCGAQAGESVSHVHLHLLGGRALRWPPG